MNEEFGKNRVQYKEFLWSFYKYKYFDVYFYRGGKELSEFIGKAGEKHLQELEKFFDYSLQGKFEFIIYNNQSDYFQSNIGNISEDQNTGGAARIVGTKIFLYFDGSHENLERSIREGIANMIIMQLMYGGDMKESVKNSTLLNVPTWFSQGLSSYIARKDDPNINARIKDGFVNKRFNKFNSLEGEDALVAGHSFWSYIVDNYGLSVVPNILYMTKVSRSVESGLLFVIGLSVKNLSLDWVNHYQEKYGKELSSSTKYKGTEIVKKSKQHRYYYEFEVSPDGKKIAYATNELQQYKIWIYDVETGKTKKIDRRNFKLDVPVDLTIPLIEWHPSGGFLSIITEHKAKFIWELYNLETGKSEKSEIFQFDKILDYEYSDDAKYMVISAVRKGKTDIYLFKVQARSIEQVTNDYYDDFNPVFVKNSSQILFSSNRVNDSLSVGGQENELYDYSYDLFLYDINNKDVVLKRMTSTPGVNEMFPQKYDKENFTFLIDQGGVYNKCVGKFDSTLTHVDTIAHYSYKAKVKTISNYLSGLYEHSYSVASGMKVEVYLENGLYKARYMKTEPFEALTAVNVFSSHPILDLEEDLGDLQPFYVEEEVVDTVLIDIHDYKFESDTAEVPVATNISVFTITNEEGETETRLVDHNEEEENKEETVKRAVKPERHLFTSARNYDVAFQPNYVVAQLDNAFLNPMYQRYTGGTVYPNPTFNAFFKLGTTDVLEDYKIIGGFKVGNMNNHELFASVEDLKKRWDKKYIYYRQVRTALDNNIGRVTKVISQEYTHRISFPISMNQRVSFVPAIRYDRTVFMATDFFGVQESDLFDYWARMKVEYVFDNARNRGLNLYHGTRLKVFGESFYKIGEQEKYMFVFGADIRNYTKIHRQIIWANRFAASTSLGPEKLLYYLGGVDNWLSPSFNPNIRVSPDQNYAFQTIATNLRGFRQNIRNGNSFMVLNSEIRWPLFRYFSPKPIKSDLINNFQVIGFVDLGTAWTGLTPYSEDNALNVEVHGSSPITVTLQTQREPFVGGYGFGLRTRMWGYFIRADWAWGIEEGQISDDARIYLSLNLDF